MQTVSVEFGRILRTARRAKLRADGRPVTLFDVRQAIGGSPSLWSWLENGCLPTRAASVEAYCAFVGLDFQKLMRQFPDVRRAYKDALAESAGANAAAAREATAPHGAAR